MTFWLLTVLTLSYSHLARTNCLTLGSVQYIDGIPDELKAVFRTAFELDPHDLIDMAADRSPFIDQSQSFSLFVAQPTTLYLVSPRGFLHMSI